MKLYTLKLVLRGVSPMVWRRLCVPGVTSLATLHHVIQQVNRWDDDHLHRFHIYAVDYGIHYAGGLSFRDNAHEICLDDFEFSIGDKFFYEYNFFQNDIIDIRIEDIVEKTTHDLTITCINGKGMPGVSRADVMEAKYQLIKAIAECHAQTTVGDLLPYVETLQATQFDRKQMNKCLQSVE